MPVPGPLAPQATKVGTKKPVDAGGAVDAQNAPTSSLENAVHSWAFPTAPTGILHFCARNRNSPLTERMQGRTLLHAVLSHRRKAERAPRHRERDGSVRLL